MTKKYIKNSLIFRTELKDLKNFCQTFHLKNRVLLFCHQKSVDYNCILNNEKKIEEETIKQFFIKTTIISRIRTLNFFYLKKKAVQNFKTLINIYDKVAFINGETKYYEK